MPLVIVTAAACLTGTAVAVNLFTDTGQQAHGASARDQQLPLVIGSDATTPTLSTGALASASTSPVASSAPVDHRAGTNPDWGKALPPADAPRGRAYLLIEGEKDHGYQPKSGECSWQIHARYWTWGPDGKVYPTWHPARDPSGCSFGHEHGDDPRTSPLFAMTGWPAFGYTNEMLAPQDPLKQRDEDHVGHKVAVGNSVKVHAGDNGEGTQTPTGAVTMTCDSLLKFHQGTHSPDALTNNLHELIYNVRCTYADNGAVVETHFSALLPIGHPGGFTGTDCGSGTHEHNNVGAVTPPDSPDAAFDGRFIPDSDCATAVASGQKQIFTMNEFWVTGVVARAGQLRNFQLFPVFFVANPSRYFDPTATNKIGRQIDLCYQGAPGFACDQVRRQSGNGQHLAYDDPRSPFNGAQRDFSPGLLVVQNDGPTTVYTDVFARRFSTTPFPGAIQQYIAGSHAGDRSQGTIRGTFTNFASNAADKVHAPN